MAGPQLDGAGQVKMVTLEDAMVQFQRLHSTVENYALALKRAQPTGQFLLNFKRQMPALAGKLKGQFGMIADLVTAISMSASRGSSDAMRVRGMREGMASIKQQIEIAIAQTITKHEVKDKHALKEEKESH
jgi:hypothetical protein